MFGVFILKSKLKLIFLSVYIAMFLCGEASIFILETSAHQAASSILQGHVVDAALTTDLWRLSLQAHIIAFKHLVVSRVYLSYSYDFTKHHMRFKRQRDVSL